MLILFAVPGWWTPDGKSPERYRTLTRGDGVASENWRASGSDLESLCRQGIGPAGTSGANHEPICRGKGFGCSEPTSLFTAHGAVTSFPPISIEFGCPLGFGYRTTCTYFRIRRRKNIPSKVRIIFIKQKNLIIIIFYFLDRHPQRTRIIPPLISLKQKHRVRSNLSQHRRQKIWSLI